MSSFSLVEAIDANLNSVRTTLARKEDRFVSLLSRKLGLRNVRHTSQSCRRLWRHVHVQELDSAELRSSKIDAVC